MIETLQIRTHGDRDLPALIYLPGLHGDWTLATSFRSAIAGKVHFVEITYPRSLEWQIADYARAIQAGLIDLGITHGWLLGESFGSQVAWGLLENQLFKSKSGKNFTVDGVVLAGGFVKHPWNWGPPFLRWFGEAMPRSAYRSLLKIYSVYAKFRHRHAPEVLTTIDEFINRRTPLDRKAIAHRLHLLSHFDPRPIARKARIPVYYLAGLVDPLIPWPLVRHWLSRNCPGYVYGKTIWTADHNVLATAPKKASEIIMRWIEARAAFVKTPV